MKKILFFFPIVLLTIASAFAQTATLSYQAVVRDSHNKFVRNTDIDVEVRISVESTERYYETRTAHTNQNGVVSFSIGDATRTSHTGDELVDITGWRNATISVTFHLADGDVTTNSPVSAVPYALEVNPALLPTVNDATLTIQRNGTDAGTFTANQSTDQTINIEVPTTVAELSDANQYAKVNANNQFTGVNTVPSGFDLATTNATNCNNVVVNACDLFAVFDSLMRRMDSIAQALATTQQLLEALKPSLTVTASLDTVTVCSGSSYPVTYTATFHNCSSSDYTIVWKVNGTDSSNVTGQTLTLNVENAGDYEVVCLATRSDNSSVKDSVTTHVEIDTHVPSFTATTNTLTVSLSDIVNTATIQWDMDSVPIAFSGISAEHTYSVADTITITATSANGCTFIMGLRLQPAAPTVTTDSVNTIAAATAKAYGTVTSDGGMPDTKRGMVYSISDQNLKLGTSGVDSVMAIGTGKGSFACNLKRLVPCTQYYVRAFAINDVDTAYGDILNFTTLPFTCGSTLTDIDGNEYATLQLGSQCWMQQNLRTAHFADGTEIPAGGLNNHSGARRYAPDNNLSTFGYLYNWDAAMHGSASSSANPSGVQGACPDGWHLPSDAEWTQLTSFVASNSANVCNNDPGNIAKSLASTEEWDTWGTCSESCLMCTDPSSNNSTQFSALPAGTWNVNGSVGYINQGYYDGHTIFRTATLLDGEHVHAREFYLENSYVDATAIDKTNGLSVRCVLDCPTDAAYLPTVSTVALSSAAATVSMTANVISDGGATVTERGVCWGTSHNPTTSSDHTADSGTGTGEFTVTGSLTPGTTYYVRAYATNSEGTAYGAEATYVTPMPTAPPTVNTGSKFLALTEGFEASLPSWTTIDNDGDGKNWSISSDPHSGSRCAVSASWDNDNYTALTPDNYLITPDITLPTGISPILTFYHKGSGNPYYSNEHFFVKVGNAGASTVGDFSTSLLEAYSSSDYAQATVNLSSYAGQTIRLAFVHHDTDKDYLCIDDIIVGEAGAGATTAVSNVTATTATCGGYVADDGGATVTARGVCWSTSQNPTISESHTTDGSGTGSFTSNITGLNPLTTYYVRAYATNSAGTTYGNQVSFTTIEALPVVTTSAVSNITVDGSYINATCGGNVTDEGAYAVTARGVCWSTSQNPTVSDSHTTDGSGLGSFTSSITGLTSGETYYVRAYATNSSGTAYGNQVSFTVPLIDAKSCTSVPTVTDHEGNVYATVQIGEQCWMRENLRTTTSPKTGTYLVNTANRPTSPASASASYGSKVAHWYMNDPTTYASYGLLYNWCAAMDTANSTNYMEVPTSGNVNGNNDYFSVTVSGNHRGICPAGWHLPSYSELNALKTAAGNTQYNLQVDGSAWSASATNSTGFTALPAGIFQSSYGTFQAQDRTAFWSCTNGTDRAQQLYMTSGQIKLSLDDKNRGNSVRCVKDE